MSDGAFGSRWVARLRLLAMVGAVALGGQAYLDHFQQGVLGWWWWLAELGGAVAIWLVATAGDDPSGPEPRARVAFRWMLLLAAAGCFSLGVKWGLQVGEELPSGIALVGSLVLLLLARWVPVSDAHRTLLVPEEAPGPFGGRSVALVAAAVVLTGVTIFVNRSNHAAAFGTWLVALAALGAAARMADRGRTVAAPFLNREEALALFAIVLLAGALRIPLLDQVPALIDADEGRLGGSARQMFETGFPDLFSFGWNSFPNLSYLVDFAFVPLLGVRYTTLRLSSAMIGTIAVIPMFFWVRRWWGTPAAVIAAFGLAVVHDGLFWSRLALNNVHAIALAAVLLLTFARALRHGLWFDYVLFGLANGLCFHSYHAAKLFGGLLALTAIVMAVGSPAMAKRHWRGGLLSLLAFLLVVAPQAPAIAERWEMFRTDTMNRSDVHEMITAYRVGDALGVRRHLSTHVADCMNVFISIPHNLGYFVPASCALFLMGVPWLLWRWRDPRHTAVLVWLFGVVVAGGMMTSYPPYKPRLVGMLPVACIIPALMADRLRRQIQLALPQEGKALAVGLLGVWLTVVGYQNWHTQFVYLRESQSADVPSNLCRYLPTLPNPTTVYTVGADVLRNPRNALIDCISPVPPGVTLVNPPDDPGILPLPPEHHGQAVILVPDTQEEMLPLVRHYYPEAREIPWQTTMLWPEMRVFVLESGQVERSRSLRPTYRTSEGVVPGFSQWAYEVRTGFTVPDNVPVPVDVTWEGQVFVPVTGAYAFGVNRGEIHVGWDDYLSGWKGTARGERTHLAAGWHPIRVSANMPSRSDVVSVSWLRPGVNQWENLPRGSLSDRVAPVGVLGRYRGPREGPAGKVWAADNERLHPAISFDWRDRNDDDMPPWFAVPGSLSEWTATVDLPPGIHAVRLEASCATELFLDGTLVLKHSGEIDRPQEGVVEGAGRPRKLRLVSNRPGPGAGERWKVRLLWGTQAGGWTAMAHYRPN